jgi:hypothetical protein
MQEVVSLAKTITENVRISIASFHTIISKDASCCHVSCMIPKVILHAQVSNVAKGHEVLIKLIGKVILEIYFG